MSTETLKPTKFREGLLTLGVVLLIVGLIAAFIGTGGAFTSKDASRAYFFGWLFWACLTLGMTGLALLHHVVRAKWSSPLYRIWEAGGGYKMLVLMGLFFIPLAFIFGPNIWKWMDPAVVAKDPVVSGKMPYLSSWFFNFRWILYFGGLALIMLKLQNMLRKEELGAGRKMNVARSWFAPPMLAVYVLFFNFAMTDWAMSLDIHWFSTIYGVWMMNGFGLAGLSFAMMILCTQAEKAPFKGIISPNLIRDQGHMMLALTMVWAYFSLSQYLIIWSGNLPEFNVYYIARSINGFGPLGMAMILGCFAVPFLLLVGPFSPWLKTNPKTLGFIAGWIFVFRFVDFHYIISPSLHDAATVVPALADVGMLAVFGGVWLMAFSFFSRELPLLTTAEPYRDLDTEAEHVGA